MPSPCSAETRPARRGRARRLRSTPSRPARPSALLATTMTGLPARRTSCGELPVVGGQAGARVDHEQDASHRRSPSRSARASGRRASPVALLEAGGVDDGEGEIGEPRLALAAVARHARLVVDQRQLAPDQPVEQRRLADVGPADDRNPGAHVVFPQCSPHALPDWRQLKRVQPREWISRGRDIHQPRMPGFDAGKILKRQAGQVRERRDAGDTEIGIGYLISDEPVRRAEPPFTNGPRGRKFVQSPSTNSCLTGPRP